MTDPVSVLLIIGSAVVGPVQAQRLPVIRGDEWRACFSEELPPGSVLPRDVTIAYDNADKRCRAKLNLPGRLFENVVEACERAMKEVGAIQWSFHPEEGWTTGSGNHWVLHRDKTIINPAQGVRVHCVPAPSGLVK